MLKIKPKTILLRTQIIPEKCELLSQIGPEQCFLDIGLLADFSGSITDPDGDGIHSDLNNWRQLRFFIQRFIQRMNTDYKGNVKVAFEWFQTQPHFEWDFSGRPLCRNNLDTDCMRARLDALDPPVSEILTYKYNISLFTCLDILISYKCYYCGIHSPCFCVFWPSWRHF